MLEEEGDFGIGMDRFQNTKGYHRAGFWNHTSWKHRAELHERAWMVFFARKDGKESIVHTGVVEACNLQPARSLYIIYIYIYIIEPISPSIVLKVL
jgi:hypothetical protein